MGPHTQADQKAYDRLSQKMIRRKEIRAGIREKQRYMSMLRVDDRDDHDDVRRARLYFLRQAVVGEMTAKDAWDAFCRAQINILQNIEEEEDAQERWRARQHIDIPPIPNEDIDNWLDAPLRQRTLAEIARDNQNIQTF
jgi:hypothetical protein